MGGGISESRISSIDGKHRENPFAEVVYEAALAAERILVYRVLGL
jgi:hypothetical protein